ncbi:MAG: hypothetical protein JWP89_4293 [Schlesneria sp.]|nr:hypothetical protein [Schlesneria sp.]
MLTRQPRCFALALLGLTWVGCGQAPPAAPPATPTTQAVPLTKLTPTPELAPAIKTAPAGEAPVAAENSKPATPLPEAAYLGDDVVGLVVVHPKRLHETAIYRMFHDAGLLDEFEKQVDEYKIKPESIERALLVIDKSFASKAAGASGLDTSGPEELPAETPALTVKNNLKQIGLAFHNYHDTYRAFPRADGDAEGAKTGLSWRVQLLPLLGEGELYEEFHLNEPWDSEHNKTLIEKMPPIFNSPGVTEAGKTALHVFTGDAAPFHGEKGLSLAAFTDGTSNTILAVMAGADTAETWTKPGGLAFDAAAPKKALGEVGKKVQILLADGSVQVISTKMDDAEFAKLVELADGKPIDFQRTFEPTGQGPVPIVILTLASAVDQQIFIDLAVNDAEEESYEGLTLHKNDNTAICFIDEKTILWAPPKTLKKMIDARKAGQPSTSHIVSQLQSGADVAVAIDLQSQSALVGQAAMINPLLGMLAQINSVSLQVNVTEKTGGKLVELVAHAVNEQTAGALTQLANGGLDQLKATLKTAPTPPDPDQARQQELVHAIGQSATVKQVGSQVEFLIPVPEGFDKLPELLKPALEKTAQAAASTRKRNNLKQIGLAFHNFHDVYASFPAAGHLPMKKEGLSWRVHVLPFLDNAPLYNRFALDEPWDSETNKALINQMPDVYRTDGVTEVGKTSLHVFTGPGAPFAENKAPGIASFTDGTSSTILVVSAGPDTATIWTKPGGLDFNPEDPLKSLGQIGDVFNALFADGSVRAISKVIDSKTLRCLIQSADGEPIGE